MIGGKLHRSKSGAQQMILIWDGAKTRIEIVVTDRQLRCLSLAIEIGCKEPIQCGPVTDGRLSGV